VNALDLVSTNPVLPLPATFTNGGAVNEGATGSVAFSGVTGGSGAYTYSFDFNTAGAFEVAGSGQASAAVPASYLADGPGTRVVRGRVTDGSGTVVDYTTAIAVNNVPPTVALGGPYSGTVGAATHF